MWDDDVPLKASALGVVLSVLVLSCCLASTAGQGVTAGYTVYVTFFYPLHFLYNLRVTIYDQTGRAIGSGLSPDGQMIVIPVRTESTTISLTGTASGYASGPLTYYEANPAFWPVAGKSTIPVEVTGGDYWMTIDFYQ